jgi:hypothetical protein
MEAWFEIKAVSRKDAKSRQGRTEIFLLFIESSLNFASLRETCLLKLVYVVSK